MRDSPTTSPQVVNSLIVQCVSETARNLDAFPTKIIKNTYGYGYGGVDRQEKNSEAVLEVIKLCVETRNEALCSEIFVRMRDAARRGAHPTAFAPWLYYAELSASLSQYMQSNPGLDALFQPFFLDVIGSMISPARTTLDGKAITPCPLSDHHQSIIVLAARRAGGTFALWQRYDCRSVCG